MDAPSGVALGGLTGAAQQQTGPLNTTNPRDVFSNALMAMGNPERDIPVRRQPIVIDFAEGGYVITSSRGTAVATNLRAVSGIIKRLLAPNVRQEK